MRAQIIDSIFQKMHSNDDIFFVIADMGINLVEKIQQAFPSRFINVGIAEQNLIGISAGLCNLGYRPFVYTISNFLIHRCFEQIRNDIALHGYPVVLLGTSAGFDNAPLGSTHHIINDWGALKTIPGIDVYAPSSTTFAGSLVDKIITRGRPAYVRIAKGEFSQPEANGDNVYYAAVKKDVLLISYGGSVQICLKIHERKENVSLLVCNCLKPLDKNLLQRALSEHKKVIVVEDHFSSSGLYGMLCQFCVENMISCKLAGIGPNDEFTLKVGATSSFYEKLYKYDEESIVKMIGV